MSCHNEILSALLPTFVDGCNVSSLNSQLSGDPYTAISKVIFVSVIVFPVPIELIFHSTTPLFPSLPSLVETLPKSI